MTKDIIKNIPLKLDINATKRLDGTINIRLYSRDIATGQFEFTLVDEDENPFTLDETYSAQALVKYKDEEKIYLDDMVVEGNIIRFVFPHDFITKNGIVTMYIYITKDNYTSDVAAISFNVYRSEIDDIATDIVAVYDKNYEDIIANFEQALNDYKDSLPQADSVRAEVDEILNHFSVDSQAKLSLINEAEESRVEAETQRAYAESERIQAELERKTNEESRELAEDERESAEEQRKIDHANRSAELAGKANKKQEDWITPTLLNGWTDFGGVYESVGYMKDEFGFVHIRGMVKGGTVGQNAFMLPEGYKPLKSQYHMCISADIVRTLNVQSNGGVLISLAASNAWVTLNGISFKAGA